MVFWSLGSPADTLEARQRTYTERRWIERPPNRA